MYSDGMFVKIIEQNNSQIGEKCNKKINYYHLIVDFSDKNLRGTYFVLMHTSLTKKYLYEKVKLSLIDINECNFFFGLQ